MSGTNERVLVVGATAGDIDDLRQRFNGRLLFVTDTAERQSSPFEPPDVAEEVLTGVRDARTAEAAIRRHVAAYQITLSGITCFDCESLPLAAVLARAFALPFPSVEAIAISRNKWAAKVRWQRAGVTCPEGAQIASEDEALDAFERIGQPCILKPLTGSGSELVFSVSTEDECRDAFATMRARLATHRDDRMYAPHIVDQQHVDPRRNVLIEKRIDGPEYSCDFVVSGSRVTILRSATKVFARDHLVGQTLAYVVSGHLPDGLDPDVLGEHLRSAAAALGIDRALCMADFIVSDGQAVLLELSPRAGGDCLPPLLAAAGGLDVFACAIEVAEGRIPVAPPESAWRTLMGLRLFAHKAGTIATIDDGELRRDERVLLVHLLPVSRRTVELTNTYAHDAYLGYAIVAPYAGIELERQCHALRAKLRVVIAERSRPAR